MDWLAGEGEKKKKIGPKTDGIAFKSCRMTNWLWISKGGFSGAYCPH